MSTVETSKDWLQPKAPTVEQARHAVIQFRNGQGSMPVTVTNVGGDVVLQAGLNPGLTLVLTQAGAERLGEELLAAGGRWRRVDQDLDFSKYDRHPGEGRNAELAIEQAVDAAIEFGIIDNLSSEPFATIAGQDTDGEDAPLDLSVVAEILDDIAPIDTPADDDRDEALDERG